jgi:hypothetical protein
MNASYIARLSAKGAKGAKCSGSAGPTWAD